MRKELQQQRAMMQEALSQLDRMEDAEKLFAGIDDAYLAAKRVEIGHAYAEKLKVLAKSIFKTINNYTHGTADSSCRTHNNYAIRVEADGAEVQKDQALC